MAKRGADKVGWKAYEIAHGCGYGTCGQASVLGSRNVLDINARRVSAIGHRHHQDG